jgi:hypothetical protein
MRQFRPLDPNVPIFQRLGADVSPVVLINVSKSPRRPFPLYSRHGRTARKGSLRMVHTAQ